MAHNNNSMHTKKRLAVTGWRLHLIGFLLLALVIGIVRYTGILDNTSPEAIRDQVIAWGPWGSVIYLLMFTFVPLTLFPDAILAVASGMAFGMFQGFFLTWLGALLGGSLAFWLARMIGQETLEKFQTRMGHRPKETPHMKGFLSVLVLRLVPLVPFDVVSYGAGLSHVRYRDYLAATAIGIIPGVCVYVNLGDKLIDCGSRPFYMAVALLVALTVVSGIAVRSMKKNKSVPIEPTDEEL